MNKLKDFLAACAALAAGVWAVHKMYQEYDFSSIPDRPQENWNAEAALIGFALGRGSR